MAVLPGSLDYLYYNGILDRIPYEAYEMTPMTPSGRAQMAGMGTGFGSQYGLSPMMNGTEYLKAAQKGHLYDTYTYPDTFVRRTSANYNEGGQYSISQKAFHDGEGYGSCADYDVMANGHEGKRISKGIGNFASKVKDSVLNAPTWVKGLLSGGLIVTTLCCLFKKKPPVQETKTFGSKCKAFFSKLNPFKWFK